VSIKGAFPWTEEDIRERLKNDAEDDQRNFICPEQAQATLNLLNAKDKEIERLKRLLKEETCICVPVSFELELGENENESQLPETD
jgi:hypothetical protein